MKAEKFCRLASLPSDSLRSYVHRLPSFGLAASLVKSDLSSEAARPNEGSLVGNLRFWRVIRVDYLI